MQSAEFLSVMQRMTLEGQLRRLCEFHAPRPRSAARKLFSEQLVMGRVHHQLQCGRTLADHSAKLHGIRMSDSAHARRRQHLPIELFEQIVAAALQPLADPDRQPEYLDTVYHSAVLPAERRARSCPRVLGHYALSDNLTMLCDRKSRGPSDGK